MKKQISLLTVFALLFSFTFITCKKDDDAPKGKYTADEAKVELSSASQEVQTSMGEMMANPSMESLTFLMQLLDMDFDDDDWKSSLKSAVANDQRSGVLAAKNFVIESLKDDEIDPLEGGLYTFDFATDDFELTDPGVNYLMFIYPANQTAYMNQQNNAELKIEDLEIIEIEITDEWGTYTEELLTKVKVAHKIDNQVVMTCNFNAAYNAEAMPTSITFDMTMAPYSFTMTYSGSGVNYTSTLSFKQGNDVLMGYNLTFRYNSNMDDIDFVEGYYQITPIKFQGDIDVAAMENCDDYDVDCANSNLDVQVIQSETNKLIGDLEFRLYTDPTYGDQWVEPVIVYDDGSWEWLFVALGLDWDDDDWKQLLLK